MFEWIGIYWIFRLLQNTTVHFAKIKRFVLKTEFRILGVRECVSTLCSFNNMILFPHSAHLTFTSFL